MGIPNRSNIEMNWRTGGKGICSIAQKSMESAKVSWNSSSWAISMYCIFPENYGRPLLFPFCTPALQPILSPPVITRPATRLVPGHLPPADTLVRPASGETIRPYTKQFFTFSLLSSTFAPLLARYPHAKNAPRTSPHEARPNLKRAAK